MQNISDAKKVDLPDFISGNNTDIELNNIFVDDDYDKEIDQIIDNSSIKKIHIIWTVLTTISFSAIFWFIVIKLILKLF